MIYEIVKPPFCDFTHKPSCHQTNNNPRITVVIQCSIHCPAYGESYGRPTAGVLYILYYSLSDT